MILKTERLILRPWEESDAECLYHFARNPKIGPIAGWSPHKSVEESLEIIKTLFSKKETYAITIDDNAIGCAGLLFYPHTNHYWGDDGVELGYWIGEEYWGQGLVAEACEELIKHAFEDLGCTAMWCGYYDGNEKSRRCQEKCGFRYHHTEENKPCTLMGDIRTEHFSYITKEEWLNYE